MLTTSLRYCHFVFGFQEDAMSHFTPTAGETILLEGKGYVITNLRLVIDGDQYNTALLSCVSKTRVLGSRWLVSTIGPGCAGSFNAKDEEEADLVMAALARASARGSS